MQVKFWGVRGSYPVPGPNTNRYGGNTSCVQVDPGDGNVFVFDAGTGIRKLGQELVAGLFGRGEGRCHVLISHTHWDHIQGLPFFAPLYVAGNRVSLYARQRDVHLETLFKSQTQDPYFSVSMEDVAAAVEYRELLEGASFEVGVSRVRCARLNHPYIAIGYRIDAEGSSVAYVSDTAPFDRIVLGFEFISARPDLEAGPSASDAVQLAEMRDGVIDLCRGADLVVYDTMFEMEEYQACAHWGHSAPEHAVALCQAAGAKCLALFHHHPDRHDDAQDDILERVRRSTSLPVIAAAEGLVVELGAGRMEVKG
ncbi:MAG: MBL fold metallo-hydrolase [Deltaproteobacteria bacterium]|nr:MBL fold metallo-hydrolase [Deltaproteobacteria bacterium]